MAYGAVAGIRTQTGSSPTHRSCIFITKDEKVGQIYVLCLLESAVQISSARPNSFRQIKENSSLFLISKHILVFSLKVEVINCEDLEGDNCRITIYVRLNGEQVIQNLMS
jgi:hypothetical protein